PSTATAELAKRSARFVPLPSGEGGAERRVRGKDPSRLRFKAPLIRRFAAPSPGGRRIEGRGANLELLFTQTMTRRLPILLILLLLLGAPATYADHEGLRLLGTAWPDAAAPRVSEIGRGVGVVFSPDLSVSG